MISCFFSNNYTSSGFQITFGDSQILESTNYVTYQIQNFVSDIGGLAGLFLGISLLSVYEMLLKAVQIIKKFIGKESCIKINRISTKKHSDRQKRCRKHRTKKLRRKTTPKNVTSDIVIIDMLFGEQVKSSN